MKRIIVLVIGIFILVFESAYAAPDISAEFACLMEAETGTVIYEYNGYEQHSMASTTKIMTALVALESSNSDDLVKISTNAAYQEGSSAYLSAGETIKMEDLLYGLMLNSGNDAAVAVAEHICGTEKSFAELMTQFASSVGAENTEFKNASGLDADGHYTTAFDLALITSEALKNEKFRQIVSSSYKTSSYSGGTLYFSNHNKLLKTYDGCIGVKTGFTKKTGRCLVSAAEKNGITLICVTLRAPDDWNDHRKLLDYGFENVELQSAMVKGRILRYIPTSDDTEIAAVSSEELKLPFVNGVKNKTELVLHTIPDIEQSVAKGEKIGECDVLFNGKFIKSIDILAGEEFVKKKSFFENITQLWTNMFKALERIESYHQEAVG